jgi:aminoglycoside phosphotransferase family enzyme/predicted kinase
MPDDALTLIAALKQPAAYAHPVAGVRLIETHISWLLLTGAYAYKIKKPVDFGFLDFSTLEKRRFYCLEELRLNRRLAPELYLDVVPITGSHRQPHVHGTGGAIEYAVKMRQFDDANLLNRLIEAGRLEPWHIDRLAAKLASLHAGIPRSTAADAHGMPEKIHAAAVQNFTQIRSSLEQPADVRALDDLETWSLQSSAKLRDTFLRRKREGFVRECHGDAHLGNIVLIDGNPTLFDCIEFNEDLRWIDVISELAFTVMDVAVRQHPELAFRLLNQYLEITGDYAGLALFDFYRLYRAMVRAKIATLSQIDIAEPARRASLMGQYRRYIDYALGVMQRDKPVLLITHGLSGSGKSYVSARLAECLQLIRLRSDVERKRLCGHAADADTRSGVATGIYSADISEATYRHLGETARWLLTSGLSVIVDASFLQRSDRLALKSLAESLQADYCVLDLQASADTLRERIRERLSKRLDPSEANLEVLDHQLQIHEPLTEEELEFTIPVDTSQNPQWDALITSIRARCRR